MGLLPGNRVLHITEEKKEEEEEEKEQQQQPRLYKYRVSCFFTCFIDGLIPSNVKVVVNFDLLVFDTWISSGTLKYSPRQITNTLSTIQNIIERVSGR